MGFKSMNLKRITVVFLKVFLFILGGCSSTNSYNGSGTLYDYGPGIPYDRYRVILGTISLFGTASYSYEFSGLPERQWVVGLMLSKHNCSSRWKKGGEVEFNMVDQTGTSVISEKLLFIDLKWTAPLNICSEEFGYIRKRNSIEKKLSNGDTCYVKVYTGVDRGRGTYFVPKIDKQYKLEIMINSEDSNEIVHADVVLRDVGIFDADLEAECGYIQANETVPSKAQKYD